MHSLNNRGVHTENLRIFPNCALNKMDYRQKMIVPSSQKLKHQEEEDDDDVEALRLAALKSLGAKHTLHSTQQSALLPQQVNARIGYPSCPVYNHQRQTKRGYYQNRLPRQNGNTYYPSRVNQNLIEIIPVEEDETLQKDIPRSNSRIRKLDIQEDANIKGESKFYRYKDNASGSEEEDAKESERSSTAISSISKIERLERGKGEMENRTERENQSIIGESQHEYEDINEDNCYKEKVQEKETEDEVVEQEVDEEVEEEEEEQEEDEDEEEEEDEGEGKGANDDDDDILLMADLEEEDSLERLMDEMEREMNVDKHVEQKNEKKLAKKEGKESKRTSTDVLKVRRRKSRIELDNSDKNGISAPSGGGGGSNSSSLVPSRKERRSSVSPRPVNRTLQKRRSLSPKPRPRRKSPRRSPRRSPVRLPNKSFRDLPRARSPRKLSPVSRLSPRRSPVTSNNRSPTLRKSSPRATSPPPVHSRSPRIRRSRSPRRYSRSRSPKRSNRSKSPRQIVRSRSPPRGSPVRITKLSPRATTPRSVSPRSSSPLRRNSPRRVSPRPMRSPKLSSPTERRRLPSPSSGNRLRSPGRSPWSSPRNSPRLSPRRRRSPKESRSRKPMRGRSVTPEEGPALVTTAYKRQISPLSRKTATSPDVVRPSKEKQKEPISSLSSTSGGSKESADVTNNPILEARRRKFESTKPIDPVHDNKKIKLGKKDNSSKIRVQEQTEVPDSPKSTRKKSKLIEEDYEMPDSNLCLTDDYVYEVLEDVVSDASSGTNAISMHVEMVPVKVEKERTKKKKKRDKELYQVGKMKGELPLSERLGKEKKCKKRKERVASPIESSPEQQTAAVEDLTVDEEADLRTELSRRRAERLNRAVPIQSARLLQSAFKGVVNEVAKTNAKAIQRHAAKGEDKNNKKEVRRVTVLHRTVTDMPDSEDEAIADSKVPIRFRLGINKPAQETSREPKAARKSSKRPGRK